MVVVMVFSLKWAGLEGRNGGRGAWAAASAARREMASSA